MGAGSQFLGAGSQDDKVKRVFVSDGSEDWASSVEVYPDTKPVVTAKVKATVAPYQGIEGFLRRES